MTAASRARSFGICLQHTAIATPMRSRAASGRSGYSFSAHPRWSSRNMLPKSGFDPLIAHREEASPENTPFMKATAGSRRHLRWRGIMSPRILRKSHLRPRCRVRGCTRHSWCVRLLVRQAVQFQVFFASPSRSNEVGFTDVGPSRRERSRSARAAAYDRRLGRRARSSILVHRRFPRHQRVSVCRPRPDDRIATRAAFRR